jgi:hypothetical protein
MISTWQILMGRKFMGNLEQILKDRVNARLNKRVEKWNKYVDDMGDFKGGIINTPPYHTISRQVIGIRPDDREIKYNSIRAACRGVGYANHHHQIKRSIETGMECKLGWVWRLL